MDCQKHPPAFVASMTLQGKARTRDVPREPLCATRWTSPSVPDASPTRIAQIAINAPRRLVPPKANVSTNPSPQEQYAPTASATEQKTTNHACLASIRLRELLRTAAAPRWHLSVLRVCVSSVSTIKLGQTLTPA